MFDTGLALWYADFMNDPFAGAIASLEAARAAWRDAGGESFAGMAPAVLVAVSNELGAARRHVEAILSRAASEVARQSRGELGKDGLARKQGFRSPNAMISAATGATPGDAARLMSVGDATAPRMTLTGETAPPKHPHVAAALDRGTLGMPAASAIVARLDKLALKADPAALDAAEAMLAERAPGLTVDQLNGLLARLEAHLDPDGVEPREDELRTSRVLRIRQEASGAIALTAVLDPESGAYVKAAIDALVTAGWRRGESGGTRGTDAAATPVAPDDRSMRQRQADALVDLCRHALGCDNAEFAHATTTVVVRMTLDDLQSGRGTATIDGLDQPISVATARRMAAQGQVIPCVLGGDSEILDWGRAKRLFTPAQRLALVERDGGCAFCGLDPHATEGHHIRWWDRDAGPTDLRNGVLLCTRCHHRVHDDGWDIRIDGIGTGAQVWFIPPPWLDAERAPRLGGNARYRLAA